jgi:hypothetical protein
MFQGKAPGEKKISKEQLQQSEAFSKNQAHTLADTRMML